MDLTRTPSPPPVLETYSVAFSRASALLRSPRRSNRHRTCSGSRRLDGSLGQSKILSLRGCGVETRADGRERPDARFTQPFTETLASHCTGKLKFVVNPSYYSSLLLTDVRVLLDEGANVECEPVTVVLLKQLRELRDGVEGRVEVCHVASHAVVEPFYLLQ